MIDKFQWYSEAFQNLPGAILIVDDGGSVLFANLACGRLIGCPAGDLHGRAVTSFLDIPRDPPMREGDPLAGRACLKRKGRAPSSVHVSVQSVSDPDGGSAARICMIQPETGPGAAGFEEQSVHNPYRVAFRNAPAKVLIVDGDGDVVDTTDLFLRHFGYGRHEVAGRPFAQLVPPELRVAADAVLDPDEVLLARSRAVPLAIADREGKTVQVELEISRQPDRQLLVFVIDMAEAAQVRSELELRTAELERLNENLQNFAAIASHDMQEPLRKIRYFSEMLRRALEDGHTDDVDYSLKVLGDAASRASRMVSDLLTFSRSTGDDLVREPIDLADMLQDLVADFEQGDLVGDAEIHIDVSHCQISGDPTAISQLFRNLIGNALKYRSPVRRLLLKIEAEVMEHPSPRLRVRVSDNGIGFEPQYADTIFQPFRRLHRRHLIPGNGIGLAICEIVARRHDWRLTAEGRLNEGAAFTVEIPNFSLRKEAAQ